MKRFFRTMFFFATFMLSLAAVAPAQDDGACSPSAGTGTWGYTATGTLVLPTGAVPFAIVGRSTSDANGTTSATQTSSLGGQISQDTVKWNAATVNPDCTTTFSVGVYDKSGTLLRTVNWAGVYVDNGSELRAIITSLVVANGTPIGMSVPAVVTMHAKKLFPAYALRFSFDSTGATAAR